MWLIRGWIETGLIGRYQVRVEAVAPEKGPNAESHRVPSMTARSPFCKDEPSDPQRNRQPWTEPGVRFTLPRAKARRIRLRRRGASGETATLLISRLLGDHAISRASLRLPWIMRMCRRARLG